MTETTAPDTTTTRRIEPLRVFVGALVVLGCGGVALLWRDTTVLGGYHLPFLLLVLMFYLAETCLVHLHFRRGAHSFSMSEVPIVLGLFFTTPRELLLAQFVGCTIALALQRRQGILKAAFNLANFAVSATVAVLLLRIFVSPGGNFGIAAWSAAALAIVSSALLGAVNVSVAISISERRVQRSRIGFAFAMLLASAFTNLSIGLVTAIVLEYRPSASWLLAIPAITVFVAYRAYIREREKHEILEFLYAANRLLTQNPELERAIIALLEQARSMFRTETAEALVAPPGSAPLLRIRVDNSGQPKVMEVVNDPAMLTMWERISGHTAPIVLGGDLERGTFGLVRRAVRVGTTAEDNEYLAAQGLRNAMVAPLLGETRTIGMLMLGDRLGESASFQAQDKRLFEALASHVSVALENGRLEQSLVQLRELEQKLTQLAFHDPLTGLANRTRFAERVIEALESAKAEHRVCAVLFIDLDDFKTVNDTLGHEAGDQLLQAVAERITSCLRPSDQSARLGGDEFAVIIDDAFPAQAAESVAARITDALRLPITVNGCELYTRASIGIATSQDVRTADEMLRNADLAMYMAKADGKGRYRWFRSNMRAEAARRLQLKSDLERAADRGEFQVHFQPIVDLQSGRPVAAEALVRWIHPERGLIFPKSFISTAEQSGLINEIGRFVLRTACTHVAQWNSIAATSGNRPFAVTVNLSPAQFSQSDLLDQVESAVNSVGIDPACLILEVTEGLMLQGSDRIMHTLNRLSRFGVRLAMDDFGTGYASLSSLRELPMDMIKIAKTFTDDIDGDGKRSPFVRAMIELGEALGLVTLAEGIETPEQANELTRLGCQLGQGYYFARPVPAAGIEILLQRDTAQHAKLANVIAFPA